MSHWLKNAIFYQIYPQSFQDSNADGIGDFNGIIRRLDYLKDLGITAIWMNPCFASPFSDAGYDVTNYYQAAPRYGTNEDLKHLFDEVHKRGMHILLDLVPGHTSVDCPWFQESLKAEKNPYSDRYVWTDSNLTDISGVAGIAGTLRGISDRDGCCGINFYSTQPALNYGFGKITEPWQLPVDAPAAIANRQEMLHVIRFWLKLGCDGFRVDMASQMVKNDAQQQETIKLWQDILGRVKGESPQSAFVSEWGDPPKALEAGFDMDFLLFFGPSHYIDLFRCDTPYFSKEGQGSAKAFFEYYLASCQQIHGKGFMCIPSGNHDMPRLSSFCDATQIKLVYAFMMSMPGIPFLYYGDEIGMRYLNNITSVEGGYHRTGARTPMQWDHSVNSGFSAAAADTLYIMQDPDPSRPTVEDQMQDSSSILNELKRQIQVRKSWEALQERGDFALLNSGYPLAYQRSCKGEDILVVINPQDRECRLSAGDLRLGKVLYSLNGNVSIEDGTLIVPPLCATYVKLEKRL